MGMTLAIGGGISADGFTLLLAAAGLWLKEL
jgi:hypothetical protein